MRIVRRTNRTLQATVAALLATCAVAAPAGAADLPRQAPVLKAAPLPTVNWTGFYLGLGGGYGMYSAYASPQVLGISAAPEHDTGGEGFFGTAIAGFDWQFSNRFVAGVFADYDFGSIKGDHTIPTAAFGSSSLKMTSAWAIGARGGWLVSPSVLSYFTAGYTQARFEGSNIVPAVIPGLSLGSETFGGYFVGGGVEAMFAPGWSVRGEYRYAVYDTEPMNVSGLPFGTNLEPKVQTVRAVVTRKFGWPGSPSYPAFTGTPTNPAAWNGFYVFGGGGLGVFNNDVSQTIGGLPVPAGAQTTSGKGYFGTVGGGYDLAVSNNVVLGVFADYDLSNIKGRAFGPIAGIGETTLSWSWAVGGRLGWLADPSTLLYGTGGYTQAHFDGFSYLPLLLASPDTTYDGWFVGAGVERGLWWNNVTLRTEYRYAKYSDQTVPLTLAGVPFGADRNDIAVQTVRSTLAYKFNWTPASVTARY